MFRKAKDTEIAPRKDDAVLAGPRGIRSPYDWFDDLRQGFFGGRGVPGLVPWTDAALRVREPPVEILNGGREFVVKAELPGVTKEDVDLNVTPDGIEIRGRRTEGERRRRRTTTVSGRIPRCSGSYPSLRRSSPTGRRRP